MPATRPISKLSLPDLDAHPTDIKEYATYYVNENPIWSKHPEGGHAFFASRIDLPEPMRLDFLFGCDGPFRLWLDGEHFIQNMKGINPITPDEKHRLISLPAGLHDLRIAMDINFGQAWGFMLRTRRADVTAAQIQSGDFARPVYMI